MELEYHTLDVFTGERFSGNPLAVVSDGRGLTSAQMQAIAREFNLSETVFVLPAENPAHSARIRIFTPARELPFAGHPTIGAAILIAETTGRISGTAGEAILALEETIGTVRVGVRRKAGDAAYAEFDTPRLPEPLSSPPSADLLAAALGLSPSEISFENHKPTRYSAGVAFSFVPVRGLEVIGRAALNSAYWAGAFGEGGGAFVYCRECLHTTSQFHARMFVPDIGEDPATGSAAAAFAAVVQRFDQPPAGQHVYRIEQGHEMGRPSRVTMELTMAGAQLKSVRIGGQAVRVASGRIAV
ncbi:MAG: PhzF family phenazine biosynthesis protein [Hyphomicrobiaceae bacterium]